MNNIKQKLKKTPKLALAIILSMLMISSTLGQIDLTTFAQKEENSKVINGTQSSEPSSGEEHEDTNNTYIQSPIIGEPIIEKTDRVVPREEPEEHKEQPEVSQSMNNEDTAQWSLDKSNWTNTATLKQAVDAVQLAGNTGYVRLIANGGIISSTITISEGKTVTILPPEGGNDLTATRESECTDYMFVVDKGGTLNIGELGAKTVTIIDGNKDEVPVYDFIGSIVNNCGTLNIYDGTKLTNNEAWVGGVYNNGVDASFTMEGGEISGNSTSFSGGGVSNYRGKFIMNAGKISGNTAKHGGGVDTGAMDGSFIMKGGEISSNTAECGGGVANNGGKFEMYDGAISNNTASIQGGGLDNNNSTTFIMNGGEISHNTAKFAGGVSNWDTFIMTEGNINDNEAIYRGGGVNTYDGLTCDGKFTMSGGKIINNKASTKIDPEPEATLGGGGVFIESHFQMSGGEISSNESIGRGEGNGVFHYSGTFNLSGKALISNNDIFLNYTNITVNGELKDPEGKEQKQDFLITSADETKNTVIAEVDGVNKKKFNVEDLNKFRLNSVKILKLDRNDEVIAIVGTYSDEITANGVSGDYTYRITAKNVFSDETITDVEFPTWTDGHNQDDIIWLQGKKSGNDWYVDVNLDNYMKHKGTQNFITHCYVKTSYGTATFVGGTSYKTTVKDVYCTSVEAQSTSEFTTKITAKNVHAVNGLKNVVFPTWTDGHNQDDIIWLQGQKSGNDWTVTVDTDYYTKHMGNQNFTTHVYADTNKGMINIGAKNYNMDVKNSIICDEVVTNGNPNDNCFFVTAKNVRSARSGVLVKNVMFPIWTDGHGQDDIIWVQGQRSGNDWSVGIVKDAYNKHMGTQNFISHVYAKSSSDKDIFIGSSNFKTEVKYAYCPEVKVEKTSEFTTKITAKNVSAGSGINNVEFPTWTSKNNQDDIIWLKGQKSGNDWTVTVDTDYYNKHMGNQDFTTHVYVNTKSKGFTAVGEQNYNIDVKNSIVCDEVVSTGNPNDNCFFVTAKNVRSLRSDAPVKNVEFPIWTDGHNQDDIIWVQGQKSGNDWSVGIVKDAYNKHMGTQNFISHVYAKSSNGINRYIGSTNFKAEVKDAYNSSIETQGNYGDQTFRVYLKDVKAASGINNVLFPTWTDGHNQDDIVWLQGKRNGNNWYVDVNIKDFNKHKGEQTFIIHTYAQTGNGKTVFLDKTEFKTDVK